MATNTLDHDLNLGTTAFDETVQEALALVARVNSRLQVRQQATPPSRRLYKSDDSDYGPDDLDK